MHVGRSDPILWKEVWGLPIDRLDMGRREEGVKDDSKAFDLNSGKDGAATS